ncbi:MAG: alpha-amylase/4-alpha-glucanotransferase domain-containing protein [Dehalococcoidia bacterium]
MTAHVHLGLVFHQHQPVGNYGFVFDDLYQKSYDPLLSALERHPGVKAGMHTSGPLLDWLVANKRDYLDRLQVLVDRGQVEILGGGYYEPILPAISEADRIGQLSKMRTELRNLHGTQPTGAWIAERVWEPDLPRSIASAGYDWTIVDDVHFEAAGFDAQDLRGWYLTESDGQAVGVFASSTKLRYLIPWGTVDQCIAFLQAHGDRFPGSLIAMGDDSEKFGGWPTTYAHCWEAGWVDAFFARLEKESHWIETVHLGEWRRQHEPVSLAYLPATSYMEMGEWSLPPGAQHDLEEAKRIISQSGRDDLVRFVRGGHWRNFFLRYPEVNLLHKRLLILSQEAHGRQDARALDHIWQAECNCPFWHGVFGGVYLEHIRHANFGHLAAADAVLYPGAQPPEVRDWDMDGKDEICLRSAEHAIIVDPGDGGTIQHWDLRQQEWHLTHAVARRLEAYHDGLDAAPDDRVRSIHDGVKAKDQTVLDHVGIYDRTMRLAAQDTLAQGAASREDYRRGRGHDISSLAPAEPSEREVALALEGNGVRYAKQLRLDDGVTVAYQIESDATLFSEWNLSLPEGPDAGPPTFALEKGCCTVGTGRFTLRCSHDADDAWVERLYSVSNTEGGVELAPQGWSMVFSARCEADRSRNLTLNWKVTE